MGLYILTGDGIETRPEVAIVKRELRKFGIFLEGFGIKITAVYIKPRPYGFDFYCANPQGLLALARKVAALSEDNRDTVEGRISAGQTHGEGVREIGVGPRLHLEIAMDHKCNVHVDSHGYVLGPGRYDYNRALEHGYWDLLGDKLPWLFGAFGDQGQVGPMIRPVLGLDGKMRWMIGLTGHW
jgi:hypothetical protein